MTDRNEKKSKKSQDSKKKEDRKEEPEIKYPIFSNESILNIAESVGYSELPEDLAQPFAEDVSYRLREIIWNCSRAITHEHRRELTTEDVNQALQLLSIQEVFGHGNDQQIPASFMFVEDAEVFVEEDFDIPLTSTALTTETVDRLRDVSVKAQWIAPVIPTVQLLDTSDQKPDTCEHTEVEAVREQYFEHITKAVLGKSQSMLKVALEDLRINTHLAPLLPRLLGFLTTGLRGAHGKNQIQIQLLHAAKALLSNRLVCVGAPSNLSSLVNVLVHCIFSTDRFESLNGIDVICTKRLACELMAKLFERHLAAEGKLQQEILQVINNTLMDGRTSPLTHCGCLALLYEMEPTAMETVLWNQLSKYMELLVTSPQSRSQQLIEKFERESLLLACAQQLFRRAWRILTSQHNCRRDLSHIRTVCISEVYNLLSEYFGDTLCAHSVCSSLDSYLASKYKSERKHEGKDVNGEGDDSDSVAGGFPWRRKRSMYPSQRLGFQLSVHSLLPRTSVPVDVDSVFEQQITMPFEYSDIQFCFAGAQPFPRQYLRCRRLDERHQQYLESSVYHKLCLQTNFIGPRLATQNRKLSSYTSGNLCLHT